MSGDMIFTAYLTRYALTKGIRRADVSLSQTSPDIVTVVGGLHDHHHGEGKEWHRTLEGAIRRVEKMQEAEIASLKKQIARIEKLKPDRMDGGR